MLTAIQEFDSLSEKIRLQLKSKIENNFTKATSDNILRTLHALVEASSYGYDKVQIAQQEIAMYLKLSANRVSELLKLAEKAEIIKVQMICRCGNIRNEYTLLNNPIIKSLQTILLKAKEPAKKEDVNQAIDVEMDKYRAEGEAEHILLAVKRRMEHYKIITVSGVKKYFLDTLISEKQTIAKSKSATVNTYKNKKESVFNNYEQRNYDGSDGQMSLKEIEARLTGWK